MRGFSSERSDDVTALSQRVRDSFIGRSILRFVLMEGFDRSIILSAQVFTALIPLFIIVASVAPAGQEDVIGEGIIKRFALTGASADAVEQLFEAPAGATSSVTVFSALLLIYSGVAFTRRLQRMYRAAWGREQAGIRSALFATLGLGALVLEFVVAYGIREFTTLFPFEWLWAIPISLVTGLVLWTSIPYLLLERQLHWRRLLVAGAAAAVGMTIFAIGTPIYMPDVMTRATNEFGLFGVTITLIGWLLAASFILVATTAIGAEFDSSDAPWLVRLKVRFDLVDPAAEAPVAISTERLGLTRGDLAALTRVLVNWLIMIAAVWIATAVVPGIVVNGGLGTYLAISLLFGLVNAVLGPVLYWLAGSQSWLRLGGSAVDRERDPVRGDSRPEPEPGHRRTGRGRAGCARRGRGQHPARAGVPPHPGGFERRDLTFARRITPLGGRPPHGRGTECRAGGCFQPPSTTSGGPTHEPRAELPSDPADPPPGGARTHDVRREGPGHGVPADRAADATEGCAERPGHPARRRRVRRLQRVRWSVQHPDRRAAGRGRSEVQPVPHHGAVRADEAGHAHRPQPPLRRHGQHHRDGDLGSRATPRCCRTTRHRWR